jgi:hypothetical protein
MHQYGTVIIDVQHYTYPLSVSKQFMTDSHLKIMHPVSAAICYNGERNKIENEIFYSLKNIITTYNKSGWIYVCVYCTEEIFPTNFKL